MGCFYGCCYCELYVLNIWIRGINFVKFIYISMKKIIGIILFVILLPITLMFDLLILPIKIIFGWQITPLTDQLMEWIVVKFLEL